MKKIAYIYDDFQMYCNSVSDILYNMSCQFDGSEYEQIVIATRGMLTRPLTTTMFSGLKTYKPMRCSLKDVISNKDLSMGQKLSSILNSITYAVANKIPRVRYLYRNNAYNHYYEKIFRMEKPDVAIFFSIAPQKGFSKLCKRLNIPYFSLLYDTFVSNPTITPQDVEIEREAIINAVAYFVPDFFIQDYREHYGNPNIHPFRLPLLVPKDKVLQAYEHTKKPLKFTYFGMMQAFRNADRIKNIFVDLGESLDIFSPESHPSDDTYVFHAPVQQEKLYETVASSDFLVAFDNSEPYAHYLPSKAYLYVSFTKPIIIFGDNKDSALIQFLDGYPTCYYQNIDDASLDGLQAFIKANQKSTGFVEKTYDRYKDYLPQAALYDIVEKVKCVANNE